MQAVHSGADLQSAAGVVLGYSQPAVKGKAIRIDPVPALHDGPLRPLLQQALAAAQQQSPQQPQVCCADTVLGMRAGWHECLCNKMHKQRAQAPCWQRHIISLQHAALLCPTLPCIPRSHTPLAVSL